MYSIYLLYWYKRTNTDAKGAASGDNAIWKRRYYDLSEILHDCERLCGRVRALLGPQLHTDADPARVSRASADSWPGRNEAALALLLKAIRLEDFPRSTALGAIPVAKSRDIKDVDLRLEMNDPMQINEITLHFIALRLPLHVRAVCMTIDFYSLPRVRTGPLKLASRSTLATSSTSNTDGLRWVTSQGLAPIIPESVSPGVGNSVKLTVTPEMAGSARPADFAHFVCSHDLDIDVWDAESCLALGTLRVTGLHHILRQGQTAVQMLATPSFAPCAPDDGPVLSWTSGKDAQSDVVTQLMSDSALQTCALIRIVNRGLIMQKATHSHAGGNFGMGSQTQGGGQEQEVVKSWRTNMAHRLPPMNDLTGGVENEKGGMAAILHARKFKMAKDKGKIADGNIVPIAFKAAALAEEHSSALKHFWHNPGYQMLGIHQIIQKLSVKEIEMRPIFGQVDFECKHHVTNPHEQVVLCMAAITHTMVENIAPELRDDITRGLRISGGNLEPSLDNQTALPDSQSWLLQPLAQVVMTVLFDNKIEILEVIFLKKNEILEVIW